MGFTEGCDRLGNCVLGEEQALGAVGAFSDAPVDGVSAWLLPFHEVGTEAEGEGRFVHTCGSPWVKKINMMPCLYYIGEMRAMKVIYNKNMCCTM